MSYRWTTAICIVVLAACSNGRGTLQEPPPPASPGQVEPPPTTPTDPPTPPTPPPPIEPPPPPPPPTPPPPTAAAAAGYWFGTADGPGGRTYGARALITASGDLHFIVSSTVDYASTPQLLVYGNVCCEATMDAELKSKRYLSARETDSRFRGSVQGTKLIGDAKIRGDEYKFSLDLSVRYSETLTLADLAGTYTRTTTPFIGPSSTLTFTIDPSGQLNGTHTSGCVYSGTVAIADPPRNLARLSVQVSNCPTSITGSGSLNGQYTGLGFLARDTPAPYSTTLTNVFMHSLIGPTWLGQQPMEK